MPQQRQRRGSATRQRRAVAVAVGWLSAALAVGCGETVRPRPGSGDTAGSNAAAGASPAGTGGGAGVGAMTVGGSSSGAAGSVGAGAGGVGGGGMGTGGPADATGGAGGASGSGHAGTRDGGEGGEGGENVAGSSGGGIGGGNTASHCVDVSNTGEQQQDVLEVIGTGFEAYEGHMIRILATQGEPSYGLGEAPIRDGRFSIVMPGALGDYTAIAVHIDTVRNGACDPDQEFIWQMTTGAAPGDTVWRVTPDTLTIFDQLGPCSLNGIFDLTAPLPCPSEGAPGLWARVDG